MARIYILIDALPFTDTQEFKVYANAVCDYVQDAINDPDTRVGFRSAGYEAVEYHEASHLDRDKVETIVTEARDHVWNEWSWQRAVD